jgi:hypothetical protein
MPQEDPHMLVCYICTSCSKPCIRIVVAEFNGENDAAIDTATKIYTGKHRLPEECMIVSGVTSSNWRTIPYPELLLITNPYHNESSINEHGLITRDAKPEPKKKPANRFADIELV